MSGVSSQQAQYHFTHILKGSFENHECVCVCVCVCVFMEGHFPTNSSNVAEMPSILPYFGKQKQVTYHLNLSYWCFIVFIFYLVYVFFF